MFKKKENRIIIIIAVSLLILFLCSFSMGRYGISVENVIRIILSRIVPISKSWTDTMETAVINIRLPRIILACLVGCCLSAAGTAYQNVFQNPMAAPDILGASSGACFGAALAILLGFSKGGVTISAFIFSLITTFVVYLIGSRSSSNQMVSLILSGIMISSLFSAGTSFIKLAADPSNQLPAITYWLMGSLSGAKLSDLGFAVIPMLVGMIPLFLLRWKMNLLSFGDDEAVSMGINVTRLRFVIIFCAGILTASSVAASGMIGWVGLVIPHICRKLVGNDCRYLLPASMLGGAFFLLLTDDISRHLLAAEIPIGVLTAFIGAPFFIYMIIKKEGF